MSLPAATLPLAPMRTRSRSPTPTSALCTVIRPSVSGIPTWSSNSSGAAPVPPSEPSTTMKSGVVPTSSIALQIARTSTREPTQSLKPAGLPPASSRIRPMNSMSSTACGRPRWLDGLTHFSPCGTCRMSAISFVTLARRQHPADAGLGALAQLEGDALDGRPEALSEKVAGSKSPSLVRAPK